MRLYEWMLRLLPQDFRARFGADMRDVFEDHQRAARQLGSMALLRLWARAVADTSTAALCERRRQQPPSEWRRHMLFSDVTHAFRLIARQRGFSLAVMLTIALGIGATTSVFSVANALLFRELPYANADRLVRLYEAEDQQGFSGNVALGNLDDWCRAPAIEACGAYTTADLNLAGGEMPERVRGAVATPGLFAALGVMPTAGRLFAHADVVVNAPVAVVSHTAGRRLFAAEDPVGRTLLLDGVRYDVIGVIPDVPALEDVAVWRGVTTATQSRRNHANRAIARLQSGVSLQAAGEQLDTISRALQAAYPETNAHWWGRVQPLQASMAENFQAPLGVLGGLTAVLLLLCTASAASLLAGRSASRQREMAVRLALGANRRRLVVQLFIEAVALAGGGAIAGGVLASWTIPAILAVFPPRSPLWRTPGFDVTGMAFAIASALTVSLIFGLLPALGWARRTHAAASLQLRVTASANRLRAALTFVQTALAAVLLVAAALLGTALTMALLRDPGFRTDNLQLFNVSAPRAGYADAAALERFFTQITERLRRLPQVESVGAVFNAPMSGSSTTRAVIRPDEPIPSPGQGRSVLFQVSTPGYLATMGLRLIEGRDFTAADTATSEPVTIINERLARALWPGLSAVGRQLIVYTDEKAPRTVVGVIADAFQRSTGDPIRPEHYLPFTQSPRRTLTFTLRLRSPLPRQTLQAELGAVDPALPAYELTTMDAMLGQRTAARVAITRISMLFGVSALVLAAVGLYGLVSAGVTERTREIGVRLALGASGSSVMRLALTRGMTMAVTGTAVGLLASIPLSANLKAMLGALSPSMLPVSWLVGALLIGVAAMACWIPARAAVRVDPATSLRPE